MLDINWRKYIWSEYMARVLLWRPVMAMVADYEHPNHRETMLKQGVRAGDRVLYPCADNARSFIPEELQRRGVYVDVMELYTIAPDTPDNLDYIRAALDSGVIDAVTFTSPSAARRFFEMFSWPELLPRPVIAVIGPTTAAALCDAKVNDFVQPAQATAESMIAALAEHFESYRPGDSKVRV
ncbi:uroporphyrinogen-III synthase [Cytophagia bacterium CHB2]|nr:uroporphyrinogen-III synthase [Cytophagia bacterium CHB2]